MQPPSLSARLRTVFGELLDELDHLSEILKGLPISTGVPGLNGGLTIDLAEITVAMDEARREILESSTMTKFRREHLDTAILEWIVARDLILLCQKDEVTEWRIVAIETALGRSGLLADLAMDP